MQLFNLVETSWQARNLKSDAHKGYNAFHTKFNKM